MADETVSLETALFGPDPDWKEVAFEIADENVQLRMFAKAARRSIITMTALLALLAAQDALNTDVVAWLRIVMAVTAVGWLLIGLAWHNDYKDVTRNN